VSISEEKATVTGRAVFKIRLDEQDVTARYWYTRAFARRQGRWQIVSARMTSLPQDDQ
jgi:hypothetical protein